MRLHDPLPDVSVRAADGWIDLRDIALGDWTILVYHAGTEPAVCATELAALARLAAWADRARVQLISLSPAPPAALDRLAELTEDTRGISVTHPLLSDGAGMAADALGIARRPRHATAARGSFVFTPAARLRLAEHRPAAMGLCGADIARRVEALMLVEHGECAAPADWRLGRPLIDRSGEPGARTGGAASA